MEHLKRTVGCILKFKNNLKANLKMKRIANKVIPDLNSNVTHKITASLSVEEELNDIQHENQVKKKRKSAIANPIKFIFIFKNLRFSKANILKVNVLI